MRGWGRDGESFLRASGNKRRMFFSVLAVIMEGLPALLRQKAVVFSFVKQDFCFARREGFFLTDRSPAPRFMRFSAKNTP